MKIEELSYVLEEYSEEAFLEFKKRILPYFDSHAVLYEKVSRKSAALKLEMFFQRNVFSGDRTYDDIVSYLYKNMLDKLGLDADEIVNAKMAQNEAKYPVDKAKGSAAKYDEL